MIDPDCHYGDHTWRGGGVCVRCGKRLRCFCGQFMREDGSEEHLKVCPLSEAIMEDEARKLNATFG